MLWVRVEIPNFKAEKKATLHSKYTSPLNSILRIVVRTSTASDFVLIASRIFKNDHRQVQQQTLRIK
jgi:hypothetical protein